nr:hypothetical protein [Flavobacterium covae]
MTNWKEYKLGELVAINERSIGRNFEFKSIEYIDTSSVTENKFDTPIYTTISEAPSRAKRLIANGDTIISTVRPIQKHYGFIKKQKPIKSFLQVLQLLHLKELILVFYIIS